MALTLPRWAKAGLLVGAAALAGSAVYFTYHRLTQPVTLVVAAGSIDGEGVRIMSAIATRLTSQKSQIRLSVLDAKSALGAAEALSSGKADLAIVRSDIGDLSKGRTMVLITHAVVLLITPVGSPVKGLADLKNRTLGVVGGSINRHIVDMLAKEFELQPSQMQIRDLPPAEVRKAVESKQIHALLAVIPISDKYLALLRSFFPAGHKQNPTLIPIDAAEAIATAAPAFESYELPKGTFRASPAIPDEDLTTLRIPIYLVAKTRLDNETVQTLTRAIIESRRELVAELPLAVQISAPSTDKDASIPIHPGAKQFFEGEEKSIFDKYGDYAFYGSLLLGTVTSILAAAWKHIAGGSSLPDNGLADRAKEMAARIRSARSRDDLEAIEDEIHDMASKQLERLGSGEATLGVVIAHLQRLIDLRGSKLSKSA
jgi:TRAP transporter TAXI family solute receptor